MIRRNRVKALVMSGCCLALTMTGCAYQGLNSLPLPGAVGRGPDAVTYTVEVPNVATLESNSPVMIDDVVVGSVGKMTVDAWHANVEVSVKPDVVIPANAVASVGQTSLLGSMHLALNPPLGEQPSGRLQPGATLPLNQSSTYPTTEQTLSSLSTIVNAGGLGQIGDVIHNFSAAISGREPEIRELLTRLDEFVGTLDAQRDNIVESIKQLNRVAGTFANQRDVIDRALKEIPPAIDVLIKERPNLTTALEKLGTFSDTATQLVNDSGDDLVKNLQSLEPALKSLADIGPELSQALIFATAFPYGPAFADKISKGDYINLLATFDLTYPRLKRTHASRHPLGRRERQAHPGAGRSVLHELRLRPDHGRCCTAADRGCRPHTVGAGRSRRPCSGRCCRCFRRLRPDPSSDLSRCCSNRRSSPVRSVPRRRRLRRLRHRLNPPHRPGAELPAPPAGGGG